MKKVSVLIPVYNTEKYLEKCLESVINQTYDNIEIIIIEDGSKDESRKICDNYSKKDSRVKVFYNNNNKGVAYSRNLAIDKSTGEFITFIDSDDFVDIDYIETLYNIAISNNADIVSCDLFYCGGDYVPSKKVMPIEEIEILNKIDAMEALMYGKKIGNGPSAKLFKKSLFENLRFPIDKHFEDLATMYKIIDKTEIVSCIKNKKYYYVQNYNSITHQRFNINSPFMLECGETIYNFIKNKYPSISKSGEYMLYTQAIYLAILIPLSKEYKSVKNKIKKIIKEYRNGVLNDKKAIKKIKYLSVCSLWGIMGIKFGSKIYDILRRK